MKTDYHAKFFANNLTKKCSSNTIEKFAGTLSDARVQLNPHQVDAALFAFKSPFSKGAILADEVGLGKTIEAGIVISQYWAERKRRILIIMPAALRKQWQQELQEKFFLPSIIMEAKTFNAEYKKGNFNPFDQDSIVICSYQFARSKDICIEKINWDLVVIDEAHRLRNVYKPTNKISNAIKKSILNRNKLLLTATPLQNSLMELYGLVSIIDEYTFGDLTSFKAQYCRNVDHIDAEDLKKRLSLVCQRTLRKQVLEYIKYTNRVAITEEFYPTETEQLLYEGLTDYLQRNVIYAIPQSKMMDMQLRRFLASSTFAIAGTLEGLVQKLQDYIDANALRADEEYMNLGEDYELYEQMQDEEKFIDEEDDDDDDEGRKIKEIKHFTPAQIEEIKEEQQILQRLYKLAKETTSNAKGEKLLIALNKGFEENAKNGGSKKALIFTESVRTQNYVESILKATEYADKIVLFNGSNNDEKSKEIYNNWLEKNKGTDKISGSKTADKRAALVDYFRDEAEVMIATEAAAEGINLQFCSLVVNYDLPWNPQRIEQRIGRCHRYGQKNDVVVVNFLNKKNAADVRVYEILREKFNLFDGVFGASDEVLGAIASGIDFERRVTEILRERRTPEEIDAEFDELQKELEAEICEKMNETKNKLLENFDLEVAQKLKTREGSTQLLLSRFEQELWDLTSHMLKDFADFDEESKTFMLRSLPYNMGSEFLGTYKLDKNVENAYSYRVGHPLAKEIINDAKDKELPLKELVFDYSNSGKKISDLEAFKGSSGWLNAKKVSVSSFETEEAIIFSGFTDDGAILEEEKKVGEKLFLLDAKDVEITEPFDEETMEWVSENMENLFEESKENKLKKIKKNQNKYYTDEIEKLDKWAKDKKNSLEVVLKNIEEEIEEKKKLAILEEDLDKKYEYLKEKSELEKKYRDLHLKMHTARTEIDDEKDALLEKMFAGKKQEISEEDLFTIRWKII